LNNESKRFLVTGGAGFIGATVVRHLIEHTPHQVLVVDKLTYAGNLDSLEPVSNSNRYRFEHADIANAGSMQRIFEDFKPHAVMHLAAESHVDRSIDSPAPFIETNIVGTYVLLDVATKYWRTLGPNERDGFRFHHISTDEVFGSLGAEGLFTEESPYRPNSPYAASKAASDHLVNAWHVTFGLPAVLSNSSNNYGPYQYPEKLIPTVIFNAMERKPIPVYGRGTNVRDWIHVEDHAQALVLIAERGEPGASYNVGADCQRSNIDLIHALCKILDELLPDNGRGSHASLIEFVTDRPGHDARYAIDSAKLKRDLQWSPAISLSDGLRSTVLWYLNNRTWWERLRATGYKGERLGRLAPSATAT